MPCPVAPNLLARTTFRVHHWGLDWVDLGPPVPGRPARGAHPPVLTPGSWHYHPPLVHTRAQGATPTQGGSRGVGGEFDFHPTVSVRTPLGPWEASGAVCLSSLATTATLAAIKPPLVQT